MPTRYLSKPLCLFIALALSLCSQAWAMDDQAAIKLWQNVLTHYVDAQGRVDFRGLAKDRKDLDAYVQYIGERDPAQLPSRQARLAHYINAYNALAMQGILNKDIPKSLGGFTKISFFVFQQFTIGGKDMSLRSFENDIIRAEGEERVHFALNCMSVGCPRLPRTPFMAHSLDQQLDHEARRFFAETRNLNRNDANKTVTFSEILDFYPEDFLAKQPSLIAYANQYIDRPIPEDYQVEFLDYDWTVNQQP